MSDKITGLYNIDSNNGMVSSLQLYEILYWINHSKALTNHETRIPKRDREYIVSHFNLVYNEDGTVKEFIPQMEEIKQHEDETQIPNDSYVPEVEDDYNYMQ